MNILFHPQARPPFYPRTFPCQALHFHEPLGLTEHITFVGGNEERILKRYDALSTSHLIPVTKTFDHRMLLGSTLLLGY